MHPGFHLKSPALLYITQYMNTSIKSSYNILKYTMRDATSPYICKKASKTHWKVVTRCIFQLLICNEARIEMYVNE